MKRIPLVDIRNSKIGFLQAVQVGNKQLADSFKVLEQRQKSLDMRPASLQLAGGKNNRSMDELTSGGNEGSDSKEEEAPAIIVFIIGGMTYSEIR